MTAHGGCGWRRTEIWHSGVLTAALALLLTRAAAAQPPAFSRDDVASFPGGRASVSADFNRDGWPDIAHANTGRDSVTILVNRAGDGFVRSADIAVGAGPFDLTTGDFNRDGIPDLAVANADGHSISVLLGNGSSGFSRSDIAVPSQDPRGIATADVNGDGKPDLIYSSYATGRVQVLNGNGAGGFTFGPASTSASSRAQGIATADFDRDGHVDVAVVYASGAGLRILYGNGGTAFTARAVPGAVNLNVLAVGDFNRDGWPDIAAASSSGATAAIYRGGPGGLVHTDTCLVGSSPRGIAVGDLNGDGTLDIVTANRSSNTVSVLPGDVLHPGTFLDDLSFGTGDGSRDVVLADFDGDGRLDLATANEFAASATVLSNTTPLRPAGYAFRHVALSNAGFNPATPAVAVADFDGDGRLDRAAQAVDTSLIAVLLAAGGSVTLPAAGYLQALRAADVNGNGNQDLLFDTLSPNVVGIYLGDGHGGFERGPDTPWLYATRFEAGDMNRDGHIDLVSLAHDGTGWVLLVAVGTGDGRFATRTAQVRLPEHASDVALADVNRDGGLDVVAMVSGQARGGLPSEARVWLGNGAGGLIETTWIARFSQGYGVSFALADVNRDGLLDIVASVHDQMAVAPGTGTGFMAPVYSSVNNGDQFLFLGPVATGDLNADGRIDAAFASGDIVFGNGDGTFVDGGRFDYGEAAFVWLAELTGDGLLDILASNDSGIVVIGNTRDTINRAPTVDAGPDRTFTYAETQGEDCDIRFTADAVDPDAHALTYEWRTNGAVVSTAPTLYPCGPAPGTYVYTLTVRDGRGGEASDTVTITIQSIEEIVLWAVDANAQGRWQFIEDPTAAGGVRVYDPNLGAPKVTTPARDLTNSVWFYFYADPNLTYKLWMRLKGDGNSWANDSVWVQFSGATDPAGVPKYQIETDSGLAVSLEECSGCGISGWGWEDDGWGAPNRNGVLLRFPQNSDRDRQIMVIQTREDGVSIDQVVLSAVRYKTQRPGTAKNDRTILPSTQPPR